LSHIVTVLCNALFQGELVSLKCYTATGTVTLAPGLALLRIIETQPILASLSRVKLNRSDVSHTSVGCHASF